MSAHSELVFRAGHWLKGTRQCLWVLTESMAGFVYNETADAIGWDRYGLSHLIECKTSQADFARDKHKKFRMMPSMGMGSFRYYLIPSAIQQYALDHLPTRWGLLVVRGSRVYFEHEPQMQPRNADVEISLVLHRDPKAVAENWSEPSQHDRSQGQVAPAVTGDYIDREPACNISGTCVAPKGTKAITNCVYCGKELHRRDNGLYYTWDADMKMVQRPQAQEG